MNANLRPCPFCGNREPEIEREGTARQSCIVACGYCGCLVESNETGAGGDWNRRTIEDALLAACEEMLALIRDGTCKDGSVSGVIIRAQAAIDGAKGGRE